MQKFLIDTQILIWSLISPEKLPDRIKKLLTENIIYCSQISLFEIAIKQKIGKLPDLQISIQDLETRILDDGFKILPLRTGHINTYNSIPLHPDHRDPFDRILLATAAFERIPIISTDANFEKYQESVQVVIA